MKPIHAIIAFSFALAAALPAQAQWWSGNSARGYANTSRGTTFSGTSGYPIGTSTSASPRVWTTSPGQFTYFNNPGVGYYRMNPTASQLPQYPTPIPLGGGYVQLGGLTERLGYWRAPSGYYYPWFPAVYMPGVAYGSGTVIYSMEQGALAPAQPSVGAVLADMRQFIEAAKEKGQLDQSNYENVFLRLNELTARASELSAKNGGALTVSDERDIRKQIDLLSADLARALNP